MASAPPRPPFSALPLDKTGPAGNAWGLYGPKDEIGALNMLTPPVIAAAAREIQTGERVSLDWYLNLPTFPSFNRPPFNWHLENRRHPDGSKRTVNDDFLNINTQSSSQWDGFRHYGYQQRKLFYGGRRQEELETSDVIGIDRIAHSGSVTTRAVVLDYPRYLRLQSRSPVNPLSASSIKANELKDMVKLANITPRAGDLLLLRTGFTAAYEALDREARTAMARKAPEFLGVESSRDVLEWIWESGFVAVAGDAPSFEMSPLVGEHNAKGGIWSGESWEEDMQGGGLVHQWCLGGWGVMIGEMWDLERLVQMCEKLDRWTCFVSSVPLKVPGGVASPPNAVAIF